MATGYVIAALMCAGTACEMVHLEPGVSYASEAECTAALAAKGATLGDGAGPHGAGQPGRDARRVETVCLRASRTVLDVEDRYDALETVVVHAEPRADSGYVGLVEAGHRTLVTGMVDGTKWLRVQLADGASGFVYADRLRKSVTASAGASPLAVAPPAPAAPPPPAPLVAPLPAVARTADPTPLGRGTGAEFQDCPTCPVMVRLPGGDFTMGSNLDPSERPPHRVAVPALALGKYEVTVGQWNACVAAGGCSYQPPPAEEGSEQRPITNLSWDDARQYVDWLRRVTGRPYRLPSEAEWEYAARAGTTTRYSWGDQPGVGRADCDGCGGPHDPRSPAEVSAFPPNTWGLAGMEGGVAEWVEDCWHASYRGAPLDGSAWRGATCAQHVLRGGSWKNPPAGITVSGRNFYDASVRYVANGMRVALTLP